jgi:hypothetical protein
MEAMILTKDQYVEIMDKLENIADTITLRNDKSEIFLDNQEFLIKMKISKRTAQTWRDEGRISFSQVGNKIYYKLSDVEELLEKYYVRAFKSNRK